MKIPSELLLTDVRAVAKDENGKPEFVYGAHIHVKNLDIIAYAVEENDYIEIKSIPALPNTVQHFTGYYDDNVESNPIFVGDKVILKSRRTGEDVVTGIVTESFELHYQLEDGKIMNTPIQPLFEDPEYDVVVQGLEEYEVLMFSDYIEGIMK